MSEDPINVEYKSDDIFFKEGNDSAVTLDNKVLKNSSEQEIFEDSPWSCHCAGGSDNRHDEPEGDIEDRSNVIHEQSREYFEDQSCDGTSHLMKNTPTTSIEWKKSRDVKQAKYSSNLTLEECVSTNLSMGDNRVLPSHTDFGLTLDGLSLDEDKFTHYSKRREKRGRVLSPEEYGSLTSVGSRSTWNNGSWTYATGGDTERGDPEVYSSCHCFY
mmetsp:Transcript_13015/g.26005  ORF Transcript_13015/g.26005 Transcript_13015/m.26005 type:complete len:215 (+) Transcript_13015:106-750(+)